MVLCVNCTDMSMGKSDKDRSSDRGRKRNKDLTNKDENESDEFSDSDFSDSDFSDPDQICEGDDFIIYSQEDCEKLKMSGQDRPFPVPSLSQGPKPLVDILFVLDTDDDMYAFYTDAFRTRFTKFISIIHSALNWHWFYTNTDYEVEESDFFSWFTRNGTNGKALSLEINDAVSTKHVLSSSEPQYESIFINSITELPNSRTCDFPPYCQGGDSRPLTALKAAFKANKHLSRKEALLAAVVITNTDEDPDNEADEDSTDPSDMATKPEQVIKEFKKVYGKNKKLLVFNIIILPDDEQCLKKVEDDQPFLFSSAHQGKKVAQLAQKTGGGNFSICLDDYSVVAHNLVNLVANRGGGTRESRGASGTMGSRGPRGSRRTRGEREVIEASELRSDEDSEIDDTFDDKY